MIELDYAKISFEELNRIYFLHNEKFDFICNGDRKRIILKNNESE